ncbi:hypothetical protein JCGZ_11964 [Jatropha curcas]|uniref:Uncharacterized protein n=1 Tax=Jatropha curcas TaxID=180498 RepID=A0A067KEJ3_JATCU|nr:hypothetical protein JCGZ_11964 [Jatropha curcas]
MEDAPTERCLNFELKSDRIKKLCLELGWVCTKSQCYPYTTQVISESSCLEILYGEATSKQAKGKTGQKEPLVKRKQTTKEKKGSKGTSAQKKEIKDKAIGNQVVKNGSTASSPLNSSPSRADDKSFQP